MRLANANGLRCWTKIKWYQGNPDRAWDHFHRGCRTGLLLRTARWRLSSEPEDRQKISAHAVPRRDPAHAAAVTEIPRQARDQFWTRRARLAPRRSTIERRAAHPGCSICCRPRSSKTKVLLVDSDRLVRSTLSSRNS